MKTKLLVTGSDGQLGREFCLLESSKYEVIGINRKTADITNQAEISTAIAKIKSDFVIHTAAFTDVDACEKNPDEAMRVNAIGAENIARAANAGGAAVIFFSTDYVFDGQKNSAYVESDQPQAISNYGKSKLAGERAIKEIDKNCTIIRTGWVYSPYRNNFVKSILQQAVMKKTLRVVNDQWGSPTWTKDIVMQTIKIIESNEIGLFHVASKGEVSRFELAQEICNKMKLDVSIEPVSTAQMPRPADRPMRSTLRSDRLGKLGIDVMRPYNETLDDFLGQYGSGILNEFKN